MQSKSRFAFLPIDSLVLDPDIQPRVAIDNGVVQDYKSRIDEHDGEDAAFPPLEVFDDGNVKLVADGFHRAIAYKQAGHKTVGCNVHEGDRRSAVLFAVGSNASHGLRRSNADKHRAVEILLRDEEWGKWSDREISRKAGVDNRFVGNIRKAICGLSTDAPRSCIVSRNGKSYRMETTIIGLSPLDDADDAPSEVEEPEESTAPSQRSPSAPVGEPVKTVTMVNPEGDRLEDVVQDREEEKAIREESDSNEGWVESLPLSKILKGYCLNVFRDDAVFYRDLAPARKAFGHKAAELLNKSRYIGTYGHETRSFLAKKPPEEWKACPEPKYDGCGGSGQTPTGKCGKCMGRGYIKY